MVLKFHSWACHSNLAGGENFHGRYEFVAVESMQAAAEVIQKIIELVVQ